MKPLKLVMSAFGPYPDEEIIDFRNLRDRNIFLITGPTGAGKTTIFDAISYALFGEASGSSRDNDSLRSHFAAADKATYVELEFELKGERYRLKRNPKQEAKKLRGEGFTIRESDAELELPDGKLITQIKNVDDRVASLLGINKNQFRQIVMLPQGEFRKLLEADSKEREIIFRKIFGTEAFQVIQLKLDNLQKSYLRKVGDGKLQRDTLVTRIQPGEDDVLTKLIHAEYLNVSEIVDRTKGLILKDGEENKAVAEEIKKAKNSQEKLQEKIIAGNEVNKKLQDRQQQRRLFELQLAREEEYTAKKTTLEKARKAVQVKLVEDNLSDRKNNLQIKDKLYKESEANIIKALDNIKLWEEKVRLEESKEVNRKRLGHESGSLRDKEQKVRLYEERVLTIEDLRKTLINKKAYLEQFKVSLNKEKLSLTKASERLNYIANCETEKLKINKAVDENNLLMENLKELRTKARQHKNNIKEHQEKSKEYMIFEQQYLAIKRDFESLEDRFLKEQAGILAQSLKEGAECPVCGSAHHPKPAGMVKSAPSEQQLKEAKEVYNKATEERNERLLVISELKGKKEASHRELSDTKERLKLVLGENISSMTEEEILNYINVEGPKLKEKVDELLPVLKQLDEVIKQKQELEEYVNLHKKDIETKEEQLPGLEEEYTQIFGKAAGEEEQLKSAEQEIPVGIRSTSKLLAKIKLLEEELIALEEAYKKAVEGYNSSKNNYASLNAEKEARYNNLVEAQNEVKLWEANLESKLLSTGFESLQEYSMFTMTEKEIEAMDNEILEYYKKLQSMKDSLEKVERETEGLELVNVDVLVGIKEEVKQQENSLTEKKENLSSKIKNNIGMLGEINKINEAISEDEARYGVVSDISKAANGFNEERITFERYVLAAYFDEIISAANLRLAKMAAGRFVLKRKEEKGKGQRQEGLELEVFDNYTGKARHVKTLSGGESFKASLALALGLADVVQSYAGGISLDTMFVDEGFGTLDPESLDHAIQCLIDLQKGGRLVGIISHVPELKERIDAKLEITQAKEGSKARFVI